jgi:hypothetical protein
VSEFSKYAIIERNANSPADYHTIVGRVDRFVLEHFRRSSSSGKSDIATAIIFFHMDDFRVNFAMRFASWQLLRQFRDANMNHLFVVDQFSNAIKIQSAFLNIVSQHFANLLEEKEFQNKYKLKLQFLLYRIDCLLHIIYGE